MNHELCRPAVVGVQIFSRKAAHSFCFLLTPGRTERAEGREGRGTVGTQRWAGGAGGAQVPG